MQLSIIGAKIVTDKSEIWYGSKKSLAYGIIHADRTVDLVIASSYQSSRSGVAHGRIDDEVLSLVDGSGCKYAFALKKNK